MSINIGVDVCKDFLDCASNCGVAARFTNDAEGIDLLKQWRSEQSDSVSRIILEATGRYHQLCAAILRDDKPWQGPRQIQGYAGRL